MELNPTGSTISESTTIGTTLLTLAATDADQGSIGDSSITYSIVSAEDQAAVSTMNLFKVGPSSGHLQLVASLDRDAGVTEHRLVVKAADSGASVLIAESAAVGTTVLSLTASDLDATSTFAFSFGTGNELDHFEITTSSNNGHVKIKSTIDPDGGSPPSFYTLQVKVTDGSSTPAALTSTATIQISILDINDNNPSFSPAPAPYNLPENTPAGTTIITLVATDDDFNSELTFSEGTGDTNDNFAIQSDGKIVLLKQIDYDTMGVSKIINLQAIVSDGSNTATATAQITVTDVSDLTPSCNPAAVSANISETASVNDAVVQLSCSDDGSLTYSIASGNTNTAFKFVSNEIQVNDIGAGSTALDYDAGVKVYNLIVDVSDGTNTINVPVTISINPVDEGAPTFTNTAVNVNENEVVGFSVATFAASDVDARNSEGKFVINPSTGEVSLKDTLDYETTTTYALTIQADDGTCNWKCATTYTLIITLTDNGGVSPSNTGTVTAIVNVAPMNDNTPAWSSTPTGSTISESTTIGTTLLTLAATDADQGSIGDSSITYSIVSAEDQAAVSTMNLFKVGPSSGHLQLVASLDRDAGVTEHRLVVKAADSGASVLSVTASLTLTISDYNEFTPTFDHLLYNTTVAESAAVGTTVLSLTASDLDATSTFAFSFGTGNELDHFEITTSSNNGHVKIKSTIDPDGGSPPSFYTLQVKVTDGSSTPAALTSTATIQISILDINDNNPSFSPAPAPYNLPENTPAGTTIITLVATDDDFNSELTFSEGTGDTNDNFAIQSDGKIVLLKQIDYDTMGVSKIINLQAIVSDGSNTATATAQITVTDVSDLTPSCNPAAVSANISETASVNDAVVQLSCSDDGSLTYSIASGNTNTAFKFVSNEIQVNDIGAGSTALDYDAGVKVYNLIVDVSDGTNTINVPVTISINPVDEGAPTFTNTAVNVNENEVVGFSVATFAASDVDASPHNVQKYSITSGNSEGKFVINPSTGEVSLKDTLDYETTTTYALTIQADDGTATGSGILTVNVQDINDNTPSCPKSLYIPTAVNENEASDTLVLNLTECSDPDTSSNFGSITMSITGDNGRFAVSNMLIKTTSTPLDYESATTYTLIITLTDNGGVSPSNTGTVTAIVNVAPMNDNTPAWSSTPTGSTISESTTIGTTLLTLAATDADQGSIGDSSITYSIVSAEDQAAVSTMNLFKVGPSSGHLQLVASLDRDAGVTEHRLVVKAADSGASVLSVTASLTLTISDYNEFTPTFDHLLYNTTVAESAAVGTTVLSLTASDLDATSTFAFSFGTGNELDHFEITTSSNNGHVKIKSTIDPDGGSPPSFYTLQVKVTDGSSTPAALTSTATIQISILDINDNNPSFSPSVFSHSIPESLSVGSTVLTTATATDDDFNANLIYVKGVGDSDGYFDVLSNGDILLVKKVDYDTMGVNKVVEFESIVNDGTSSATGTVKITVLNTLDVILSCNPSSYAFAVNEDVAVDSLIANISCTDDEPLSFSFKSGNIGNAFKLDSNLLKVNDPGSGSVLDYDSLLAIYDLVISATDGSTVFDISIKITLLPVNEFAPVFFAKSISVSEDVILDSIVGNFTAVDNDYSPHNAYNYAIINGDINRQFIINSITGVIKVAKALDRESIPSYVLTVSASDGTTTAEGNLTITIVDANDNFPKCSQSVFIPPPLQENSANGTVVQSLSSCSDLDDGNFGNFEFILNNGFGKFVINSNAVTVNNNIDYETDIYKSYTLTITMTDNIASSPQLSENITVIINIEPINDNLPVWASNYVGASIQENISINAVLIDLDATDADIGNNVDSSLTFALINSTTNLGQDSSPLFNINPLTGEVSIAQTLDADLGVTEHRLYIKVEDAGVVPMSLSATVTLTYTIEDFNEYTPQFDKSVYVNTSMENEAVGSTVLTVTVSDQDATSNFFFAITSGNSAGHFEIISSGNQGFIKIKTLIDPDSGATASSYDLTIEVTDGHTFPEEKKATTHAKIDIIGINDNPVTFSNPATYNMAENTPAGTTLFSVVAADVDFDSTLTYSKGSGDSNNEFAIESDGKVVLLKHIDYDTLADPKYITFEAIANDGTNQATATVQVNVTNVSDLTPSCNPATLAPNVSETALVGHIVVQLDCLDDGTLSYSITSGNTNSAFMLVNNQVQVSDTGSGSTDLDFDFGTRIYDLITAVSDGTNTINVPITISVMPVDEGPPVFTNASIDISEDAKIGALVTTFIATDVDKDVHDIQTYIILDGNVEGKFIINSKTGEITIADLLDYDAGTKAYDLKIRAFDGTNYGTGFLTVNVQDTNDNIPTCSQSVFINNTLSEKSVVNTFVMDLTSCHDVDDGVNGEFDFSMTGDSGNFQIASKTLSTKTTLDYESTSMYSLIIKMTDRAASAPKKTGTITVLVYLIPENDNTPVFEAFVPVYNPATHYSIDESIAVGTSVARIAASDADLPANSDDAKIAFSIKLITASLVNTSSVADESFKIETESGIIKTTKEIDRDTSTGVEYFELVVMASDQGNPSNSIESTIRIIVTDVNDNNPTFQQTVYESSVNEGSGIGISVQQLAAADIDQNPVFTYSIQSGDEGFFTVHANSGLISTTANAINLDHGTADSASYTLIVTVSDGQSTAKTATATVFIQVSPTNDATPVFNPIVNPSIAETVSVGEVIGGVTATDDDYSIDGQIKYFKTSPDNMWNVDQISGDITLAKPINYENASEHEIVIEARDQALSNAKTATATVTVSVTDVSDEAPTCQQYSFIVNLLENSTVSSQTGIDINCEDVDLMDVPVYSFVSAVNDFYVNSTTGVVTVARELDYDIIPRAYQFKVRVTSNGTMTDIPCTINLIPVNEYGPAFSSNHTLSVPESSTIGSVIYTYIATDLDAAPHDIKKYEIASVSNQGDGKFHIQQFTGAIKLAQELDFEITKIYDITVVVVDGGGLSGTGTVTVSVTDINDNMPVCNQARFNAFVDENSNTGTSVIDLGMYCSDGDDNSGSYGNIIYSIQSGDDTLQKFSINSASGVITTTSQPLDTEVKDRYVLTIQVSDGTFQKTYELLITINGLNEHVPTFNPLPSNQTISELVPVGTVVTTLSAIDNDKINTSHSSLIYGLVTVLDSNGLDARSLFAVDSGTGEVITINALDIDSGISYFVLNVSVSNAGSLMSTSSFRITLTDSNEHHPKFSKDTFIATVNETDIPGTSIIDLEASDSDATQVAWMFSIINGNSGGFFNITNSNNIAVIRVNKTLTPDMDKVDKYILQVAVYDDSPGGLETKTGTTTVIININGINNHSPVFANNPWTHNMPENTVPGTNILQVTATDNDFGMDASLSYSEIGGDVNDTFGINPSTGQVYLKHQLDYDSLTQEQRTVELVVKATDGAATPHALTGTTTVQITIMNVNDTVPSCTPAAISAPVRESTDGAGSLIATFNCFDDQILTYNIKMGNVGNAFDIDPRSGDIKVFDQGGSTSDIDYDSPTKPKIYSLIVNITDGSGNTVDIPVTINVVAENEHNPIASNATVSIAEDSSIGAVVHMYSANDADASPHDIVKYEITQTNPPSGSGSFTIDQLSGKITLSKSLDYDNSEKLFELVIQVTDGGGLLSSGTVTVSVLDVNDNVPSCEANVYHGTIAENTPPDTDVLHITGCTDIDTFGNMGEIEFSIVSGDDNSQFKIVNSTGIKLQTTTTELDYEVKSNYDLTVHVQDNNGAVPRLTAVIKLIVEVTGVNDHSPIWQTFTPAYVPVVKYSISEDKPIGTSVFKAQAIDNDKFGTNDSVLAYSIITINATFNDNSEAIDPTPALFTIDSATGIVRLSRKLERDTIDSEMGMKDCSLLISVADKGAIPSVTTTSIIVLITDINDRVPIPEQAIYNITISESTVVNHNLLTLKATDQDVTDDSSFIYNIESGNSLQKFQINASSGALSVKTAFDLDADTNDPSTYNLHISISDNEAAALTATTSVVIVILPTNDYDPTFSPGNLDPISVNEGTSISTSLHQIQATDKDYGQDGIITYTIVDGNSEKIITLDSSNGKVYLARKLDYDNPSFIPKHYEFTIRAVDSSFSVQRSVTGTLTISVTDLGDLAPTCEQYAFSETITENTTVGYMILTLNCTDHDSFENVTYSILSGNDAGKFTMSGANVLLQADLDYEEEILYSLIINVSSRADSVLIPVTLHVTGVEDNNPVFYVASQTVTIPENENVGNIITNCTAVDGDRGVEGKLKYSIVAVSHNGGSLFTLESATGILILAGPLDYDSQTTYDIVVEATDQTTSINHTVTINIEDVNDNIPKCPMAAYSVHIAENSAPSLLVKDLSNCTDSDGTSPFHTFTLSINSGDDVTNKFAVSGKSILTTSNVIDYETKNEYTLEVFMIDNNAGTPKQTGTVTLLVHVSPVNEFGPSFSPVSLVSLEENSSVGTSVVTVVATDGDSNSSPDGQISYSIESANDSSLNNAIEFFRIDPIGGKITTTKLFDYESIKSYSIYVQASDGNVSPITSVLQVDVAITDVNDNSPIFNQSTYSFSVLENEITNATIHKFIVTDKDSVSTSFSYELQATGVAAAKFSLKNGNTDELLLKEPIEPDGNAPEPTQYQLIIKCKDNGSPEMTATATIHITVTSVNDYSPAFVAGVSTTIPLQESQPVGTSFQTLTANDDDFGPAGDITYSKVDGTDPDGYFVVDSGTGKLFLARKLDYENPLNRSLSFKVQAIDSDLSSPRTGTIEVTVNVGDDDDNPPVCQEKSVTVSFNETTPVNTLIVSPNLNCEDPDSMDNNLIYLVMGNFNDDIIVENNTAGVIKFANSPDYEIHKQYNLEVIAISKGKSTTVFVTIIINPINDNDPIFASNMTISKSEDIPVGEIISTYQASDLDLGADGIITYEISSVTNSGIMHFLINSITGEIKLKKQLDFEQNKDFTISVIATDGGTPPRKTYGFINLTVTDINDNAPNCLIKTAVIVQEEATSLGNLPLQLIPDLGCTDADSGVNGALSYTVVENSGANIFSINPGFSGRGELNLTNSMDYETKRDYTLKITVQDGRLKSVEIPVIISVKAVNEAGPVLLNQIVTVKETDPINTDVTDMIGTDIDSNDHPHGTLIYSIVDGDPSNRFFIDPLSGRVKIAGPLDKEMQSVYHLIINVIEVAETNSINATLTVNIANENDNIPNCTVKSFIVSVPENTMVSPVNPYELINLGCSDRDKNNLTYALTFGDGSYFEVNSSGIVKLKSVVDFDGPSNLREFNLVISVSDTNYTITIRGKVVIVPENEGTPNFTANVFLISVNESAGIGSTLLRTEATDIDSPDTSHGRITYSFSNGSHEPFIIQPETADIILASGLDRETKDSYEFEIKASDGQLSSSVSVTIQVTDVNDNTPKFNPLTYFKAVRENETVGSSVITVHATDLDDPLTNSHGNISYSIESGNVGSAFSINPVSGRIDISASLDYESIKSYEIVTIAVDSEGSAVSKTGTTLVVINIEPSNDNIPVFQLTPYSTSIQENLPVGSSVFQVSATDADDDIDGRLFFTMNNHPKFHLDSETGIISVKALSDYEILDERLFTFTIIATDMGQPPNSVAQNLTIMITDVNDVSPVCTPKLYTKTLREDAPTSTIVLAPSCSDEDSGSNAELEYAILTPPGSSGDFNINATTGEVSLGTSLDAEVTQNHLIFIRVSDRGTPSLSTTASIMVTVTDVNEHFPDFGNSTTNITINEDLSVGSTFAQITATDEDVEKKISYSLHPSSETFDIDTRTGQIKLLKQLNRESINFYLLTVRAVDFGIIDEVKYLDHNLSVNIGDINERPTFSPTTYVVSLAENFTIGNTVIVVSASDDDLNAEGTIDYSIFSGNAENKFSISKNNDGNGQLVLSAELDFEVTKEYTLTIYAADNGIPSLTSSAIVNIRVTGINEASPIFSQNFTESISELAAIGQVIQTEIATDSDHGIDGQIIYSLLGSDSSIVTIDAITATIKLVTSLDREVKDSYTMVIQAMDLGVPSKTGSATLVLTVTDRNDKKPVCSPASIVTSFPEDKTGSLVTLNCTDLDSAISNFNVISYSLSGSDASHFQVDSSTGEISLGNGLNFDYETKKSFKFSSTAMDGGGSLLNVPVSIQITGVNEHSPAFSSSTFNLNISESTTVSTSVASYTAVDDDHGIDGELRYKIFSGNEDNHFIYDSISGDLIVATDLDRDILPNSFSLTLFAIDAGSPNRTGSATLLITLIDTNDNFPTCNITLYGGVVTEGVTSNGFTIVTLSQFCRDIDEGVNSQIAYTITNGNEAGIFEVDSNTGEVRVADNTAINAEAALKHYLTVKVADQGTPANYIEVFISIKVLDTNEAAPVFSNAPYTSTLRENSDLYEKVYLASATDTDKGINGKFFFSIVGGNTEGAFRINSDTGLVYLNGTLDRERYDTYNLILRVTDKGPNELSSETTLTVKVTDYNDNNPNCSTTNYLHVMNESSVVGTSILTLDCSDIDNGSNADLRYSIYSGDLKNQFEIDAVTGELTTTAVLDYETDQFYSLVIKITDQAVNGPPRTGTSTVIINILPVNEHNPVITGAYDFSISEDVDIGYVLTTVTATDQDSITNLHGVLRFYITAGNDENHFVIDEFSGKIKTVSKLDREDVQSYNLKVEVEDSAKSAGDVRTAAMNITITITDVNDNYPKVTPAAYSTSVSESSSIGQTIISIVGTDDDIGSNAQLTYSFISGNSDSAFALTNQHLTIAKKLDYETKKHYVLHIAVSDSGTPSLTTQALVTVSVLSFNEYSPVLFQTSNSIQISEDIAVGSLIYTARASDSDNGQAGNVRFSITNGNPSNSHFLINPITGSVIVGTKLDYDGIYKSYTLEITAMDMQGLSINAKSHKMNLTITLTDVNDNWPLFTKNTYIKHVKENVVSSQLITTVTANDPDSSNFGDTQYYLIGGDGNGNFLVEASNGEVRGGVTPDIDYEKKKEYNLIIKAVDGGNPPKSSTCLVRILVDDENDNAGIFHPSNVRVAIAENQPAGTIITNVFVTDDDTGLNGQTTISLDFSSNPNNFFALRTTGSGNAEITTAKVLDRENHGQQQEIRLHAVDAGTPQRTATTTVYIEILDENDNGPIFDAVPNDLRVWENATVGQNILTVHATDADINENAKLRYFIIDGDYLGNFFIDSISGQIRVLRTLNRELFWNYKLTVKAIDSGVPQKSAETIVSIIILDVNDVIPQFPDGYTFSLTENAAVGRPVGTIKATDKDIGGNSLLIYSINRAQVGSANHFKIDSNTGTISVNIASIDRETIATYVLWCRASDSGSPPLYAETRVTINVNDLNDNAPKFTKPLFTGTVTETSPSGQQVALIQAVDLDANANGIVFYSFKNASIGQYFRLDTNTGNLTTLQVFDREKTPEFKFQIRGYDKGNPQLDSFVPVHITIADINDNRPFFPRSMIRKHEMAHDEPIGAILFQFTAIDYDTGKNAELTYSILDSNDIFEVDGKSGNVSYKATAQEGATYNFDATVSDGGIPKLSDTTTVTVVTFSKVKVCVAIKLGISESEFSTKQNDFTSKLQNELQKSIPDAKVKMCGDPSPTGSPTSRRLLQASTVTIYIYATKGNDSVSSDSFIQKDDLLKVLNSNNNGNGGILNGPEFNQYSVSQVTSYPTVTQTSSTPWIETTTGIAIVSFVVIVLLFLIVVIIFLTIYVMKNKSRRAVSPILPTAHTDAEPPGYQPPSKVVVAQHNQPSDDNWGASVEEPQPTTSSINTGSKSPPPSTN
ncbi:DgyrCDS1030 [Dimorphilus gyrociliatus]|uniref:DgyrCDS1030 n=1 Tax=Dimorphilus gyrociliatus TaxID=2664684 RepID=A0A7I8V7I7_9ANNE|nr:DgyrCDS1030 [Dimorphilus gyrociliatus]